MEVVAPGIEVVVVELDTVIVADVVSVVGGSVCVEVASCVTSGVEVDSTEVIVSVEEVRETTLDCAVEVGSALVVACKELVVEVGGAS